MHRVQQLLESQLHRGQQLLALIFQLPWQLPLLSSPASGFLLVSYKESAVRRYEHQSTVGLPLRHSAHQYRLPPRHPSCRCHYLHRSSHLHLAFHQVRRSYLRFHHHLRCLETSHRLFQSHQPCHQETHHSAFPLHLRTWIRCHSRQTYLPRHHSRQTCLPRHHSRQTCLPRHHNRQTSLPRHRPIAT